ncbi:MAG: hypothetical protein ACOYEO_03215 [bacterium]
MREACIFRIISVSAPEGPAGPRYRCLAADIEFGIGIKGNLPCDDCTIPKLMAGDHCLYLEPQKYFLNGYDSVVALRCSKLDTILPDKDYCLRCPSYTQFQTR